MNAEWVSEDEVWITGYGPAAIIRANFDNMTVYVRMTGRSTGLAHNLSVNDGKLVYKAEGWSRLQVATPLLSFYEEWLAKKVLSDER